MSTRSSTVIKDLKTGEEAVLYNHYDGYLSGAGFDLIGYINLMKKAGIPLNVSAVKKWYLENGDGYEETDAIHGDVQYIYELELNGEKSSFNLRAFTAKMPSARSRGLARKGKEVTDKLLEELESAFKIGALDDVKGFRPQDCAECRAEYSSLDEEIYDTVADTIDLLWDNKLREELIDGIVGLVKSKVEPMNLH